VVFDTLHDAGQWVKGHPQEAAKNLAPLWGNIPPETVELANSRRSYDIVPVKIEQLAEQQRIADSYYDAKLIPKPLKISDIAVWVPKAK
jgi:sulfonate transport system substrate-binding protein